MSNAARSVVPPDATAEHELRGLPASRGQASGAARIVHDPQDRSVRAGDVVVCYALTPAWTSVFSTVAAMVAETGGPLSNAVIAARELRVPVVVGVRGVLDRVRDGDMLNVDGDNGVVRGM